MCIYHVNEHVQQDIYNIIYWDFVQTTGIYVIAYTIYMYALDNSIHKGAGRGVISQVLNNEQAQV